MQQIELFFRIFLRPVGALSRILDSGNWVVAMALALAAGLAWQWSAGDALDREQAYQSYETLRAMQSIKMASGPVPGMSEEQLALVQDSIKLSERAMKMQGVRLERERPSAGELHLASAVNWTGTWRIALLLVAVFAPAGLAAIRLLDRGAGPINDQILPLSTCAGFSLGRRWCRYFLLRWRFLVLK